MPHHVLIDGNNLLHAMHAHAPLPAVGRETLVRVVERWARRGDDDVTIVFDGGAPRGGLAAQFASSRVTVRFSAPATADDVIVALIARAPDPSSVRVVSGDKAVLLEAGYRRCVRTAAVAFVSELFREPNAPPPRRAVSATGGEKPGAPDREEAQQWLAEFGLDGGGDEPFDGADAMLP